MRTQRSRGKRKTYPHRGNLLTDPTTPTATLVRYPGSDEYVLMQHPPTHSDPVLAPALAVVASAANPRDARPRPKPAEPTPTLLPPNSRPAARISISLLPENLERVKAVARRIGASRDATIERAACDYAARICAGGRVLPDVPKPRGRGRKGVSARVRVVARISAHAFDTVSTLADVFYNGNRSAAIERAVVWFTAFMLDVEDLCQ